MRCHYDNQAWARQAGAAFAEIRRKQGLRQEDLARLARVHINTVSNIERGLVDPPIVGIGLICLALHCRRIEFEAGGWIPVAGPDSQGPLQSTFDERAMARLHGNRVRLKRLELGLGQSETARMAGLHPNSLANFEQGLVAPVVSTACRIYSVLGIPYVDGTGGPVD